MKRLLIVLSVFVVLGLLLSACAPVAAPAPEQPKAEEPAAEEPAAEEPSAEATTVTVWFHSGKGEERDVLDAQVEAFNAANPDVQIDAVRLPEGSYNDQVNAAALAGDLPCLLDFDGPFLYNYVCVG